jgi:predicted PurR-regulated permease PerM
LAVLFAVLVDGGVRALRARIPMPRWSALLLLWLGLVFLVSGGSLLLAPQVASDMSDLGERIPEALAQIDQSVESTHWGRRAVDQLSSMRESGTLQETVRRFLGFFSSVLGIVTGTLLVVLTGMLYLEDGLGEGVDLP